MAIKAPFEFDDDDRSRDRGRSVIGVPRGPERLRVKFSSGETMEIERPRIVRTRRLDGLTLNRDVVRALGRLEARNRALGGKNRQLPLDL